MAELAASEESEAPLPSRSDGDAGSGPAIGRRIRTLRRMAGLSQQELGGAELSASYVSRIESGDRTPPLVTLRLLAERLGCDVAYLGTGVGGDRRAGLTLHIDAAHYTLQTGDPQEVVDALDDLRTAGRERGDDAQRRQIEELAAQAFERVGRQLDALATWNGLLATSPVGASVWTEAAVGATRLCRLVGDLTRGVEVGERCLAALEQAGLGNTPDGVRMLLALMAAFIDRGDLTHAAELGRDALRRAEATGDVTSLARAYWNSSHLHAQQGDTGRAAELAERAIASFAGTGQPRQLALVQVVYAHCLTRLARPEEALAQLLEASAAFSVVGTSTDLSFLELEFGRVALEQGRLGDVGRHVRAVLESPGTAPIMASAAHLLFGRAELRLQRPGPARDAVQAAATTLAAIGAGQAAASVWVELADILDDLGDVGGARDAYRAAAACAGVVSAAAPVTI